MRVPQLSGFILRKFLYQTEVRELTIESPLSVMILVVFWENDPGSVLDMHGRAAAVLGLAPELHLSSKPRDRSPVKSSPRRAPSTGEESRAGRAQQSLEAFLTACRAPAAEALAVLLPFVSPPSSKVQLGT